MNGIEDADVFPRPRRSSVVYSDSGKLTSACHLRTPEKVSCEESSNNDAFLCGSTECCHVIDCMVITNTCLPFVMTQLHCECTIACFLPLTYIYVGFVNNFMSQVGGFVCLLAKCELLVRFSQHLKFVFAKTYVCH